MAVTSSITFVPSPPPALRFDNRHFPLDFLSAGAIGAIGDRRQHVQPASPRQAEEERVDAPQLPLPDLLVCTPVTRRYRLIPRMEEMKRHRCLVVFVGSCGSGVVSSKSGRFSEWRIVDSMSIFTVICAVYQELAGLSDGVGTVRSCVFSDHRWDVEKNPMPIGPPVHLRGTDSLRFLGRAAYFFWSIEGDNKRLLSLLVSPTLGYPGCPMVSMGRSCEPSEIAGASVSYAWRAAACRSSYDAGRHVR
jgi:hypothetical protein